MRRLNMSFFMRLGAQLDALSDFSASEKPPAIFKANASQLQDNLNVLLRFDINPMQLPATYPEAKALMEQLERVKYANDEDVKGLAIEIWMQAFKLNTILQGEMAVQAVYHIWPKRAYDTNRLVDSAASVFSESVALDFSKSEQYDIDQAGKCLALEVPTAAAFHLLRLTESVIRRYYTVVVGTVPKTKMRNWGAYIKNLKGCSASSKVIFALEEIRDVYRNPVIHPEEMISLDEALSLLGIVETAISAMHNDMSERRKTSTPLQLDLVMSE